MPVRTVTPLRMLGGGWCVGLAPTKNLLGELHYVGERATPLLYSTSQGPGLN